MTNSSRPLACMLVLALCGPCMAADKPFVTVNGTPVSQTTAAMYMDKGRANGMSDPAALEAQVREQVIQRELLFQAARKAGFDRRPDVASEAEAARRKVLAEADAVRQTIVIQRYAQFYVETHPVSDKELRVLYDRMRAAAPLDKRVVKAPAFEDMKPMLRKQAEDQVLQTLTGELRASARIR